MNVTAFRVPGAKSDPLAAALSDLAAAKAAEEAAHAARLMAEETVLLLAGELPPEGTTRHEAGAYRAVIQTSIRRSIDADVLAKIAHHIPEAIGKRVIRWKPELDTRELRFIQNNEPDIYAKLSMAITAKPAKPSVRVEKVEG